MGKCQLSDPYNYQEKFVIEVSSREACRSSTIQLNFIITGTQPENLSTEVQLHYPIVQSKLIVMQCLKVSVLRIHHYKNYNTATLQMLDSLGKDHLQMQDPAKAFHSQLNGYV